MTVMKEEVCFVHIPRDRRQHWDKGGWAGRLKGESRSIYLYMKECARQGE